MANEIKRDFKIFTARELITSEEQKQAILFGIRFEKNEFAVRYRDEAKILKFLASKASSPQNLVEVKDVRSGLLIASGLSANAVGRLDEREKVKAVGRFIAEVLESSGTNFADILESRYFRTKNQTLKRRSRRIADNLANRKFFLTLISVLNLAGVEYRWKDTDSGEWFDRTENDTGIEKRIRALYWQKNGRNRLLTTRTSLPLIGKNVDLSLFDASPNDYLGNDRSIFKQNTRYIALGELKGGVDPAGADEHWKTANFALNRIRASFQQLGLNPHTFFIGAAIAFSMAEEICRQLKSRVLDHAANLSNDDQLTATCDWLMNV